MLSNCSVGTCSVTCSEGDGCVCIGDANNPNDCKCRCSHTPECSAIPASSDMFDMSSQVRFKSQNVRLSDVASWLDGLVPERLAIPAADMCSSPITMGFERISMSELINELGLVRLGSKSSRGQSGQQSSKHSSSGTELYDGDWETYCC